MQYNPYAPPQAAPPQLSPGAPGPNAGPQPWSIGEALSVGWDSVFWTHFGTLVLTVLVSAIPGIVIGQVSNQFTKGYADPADPLAMFQEPAYWVILAITQLAGAIVGAFFQGGLIKIWLGAARGQTLNFGDLFSGGRTFLPILAYTLMIVGLMIFSAPLLWVPAIIIGAGTCLTPYYLVDENIGFIDALKKSWQATTGHKGSVFLYYIVMTLILICGFMACCVGYLAALPMVMVGMAFIYTRLSGNLGMPVQGWSPPGYGSPPPGYPPQGGFGPPPPPGGYGAPPGY